MREKTIRVEVTDRHIREGRRNSCNSCPVALAIKDAGVPGPLVYVDDVFVPNYEGFEWEAVFLGGVSGFIDAFDCEDKVQPFGFDLILKQVQPALGFSSGCRLSW